VAIEGDGDFVVAWGSPASDPGYGIRARRFDSAGTALSADLVVNSITQEEQKHATIAMDDDGDFVIAWATQLDGSSYGIFARRFASSGGPVGIDFQVNVYTSLAQVAPAAAMDADGDFVIVWQSYPQDFSASGVFGRRFASSGASQGTEFQVNLYTFLNQQSPAVGMEPDGDFVVAWQSLLQDTSGYAVMARRFASAGNGLGAEFQVNSNTGSAQRRAAVDTAAGGAFVVAWESEDQDGAYTGVFGQRFDEIGTLDVDGNGVISALTDGLLFLRFAFQFSGTTLTNGAVGPGCTRCDATAVTGYLNGLGLVLDIDGNGAIQPLADGLLVLRFEFGFTGTTLTSGAVGPGCTRCDHTTILPYLQSL
jgi:hypothetical protein